MSEEAQSVFEEPLSEDSQTTRDYPKFTQVAFEEEQSLARKKGVPLSSKLPLPLYILVMAILLSPLAVVGALLVFLHACFGFHGPIFVPGSGRSIN